MTTPPPPTIAELIESLGAPRNYAEQCLLRTLRRLETQAARHEPFSAQYHALWIEVHVTCCAIECFREHGAKPVLEGVVFSR